MKMAIAVLFGLLSLEGPLWACGICMPFTADPLALPHPRAIEIAVATRRALEDGLLSRPTPVHGGSFDRRRDPNPSGVAVLRAWIEGSESLQRPTAHPRTIHIVFVDTGETCTLHFRSGRTVIETQMIGACDAVIATTVRTMEGLAKGQVAWKRCVARCLAVVETRGSITSKTVFELAPSAATTSSK